MAPLARRRRAVAVVLLCLAPEVGGFSTAEALAFVRNLRGINLVGCDVVEVSPPYDGPGAVTALAGATVMYELLSLRALMQT